MDKADVFSQYRPLLFSIAYNMLGTAMDAEDIVQEAFLRWQQASEQDIHAPKAYLSAVVTHLCINYSQTARVRRETYVGPWLPEPLVAPEPDPDAAASLAEALSIAFLVVLDALTPAERAAYLLRQVFDYDYAEIAEVIGKSEANCRQLVSRARQRVLASRLNLATTSEPQQQVVMQFAQACLNGDLEGLMALLTEDVTMQSDGGGKAKAAMKTVLGADKVGRYLLGLTKKMPEGASVRPMLVNRMPGLVLYFDSKPYGVLTFHVVEGRIRAIYNIVNPDKLTRVPKQEE